MTILTTYLCSEKMFALSSNYLSDDAITVTAPNGTKGQVTAKLIQNSALCTLGSYMLEAKIIEEDGNKYCALVGAVSWGDIGGYIEITYSHPNHCHWYKTVLWVSGSNKSLNPLSYPNNIIKISYPTGGACPESKSDVFGGGSFATAYLEHYTGDAAPGDLINCSWYMWDRVNDAVSIGGGFSYWSTDKLTGGKVLSVNGSYGSESLTYLVRVEGKNITCVSSDFVEYAVDDWVVIQKSGNMILPLQIGDFVN